jgi:hypothetical protein
MWAVLITELADVDELAGRQPQPLAPVVHRGQQIGVALAEDPGGHDRVVGVVPHEEPDLLVPQVGRHDVARAADRAGRRVGGRR